MCLFGLVEPIKLEKHYGNILYIKKDNTEQYYWVLKSSNGETIRMSSESYDSKQGAQKSISWTQANGKTTDTRDLTVQRLT